MHPRLPQRILILSPLTVACAEGDSTGFGGTDAPCLAEYGYRWCVRVEGAFAELPPGGVFEEITDPADNDLAPKGCACASLDENTDLNAAAVNNQVVIGASMSNNLRNGIRDAAYQAAEAHCVELADFAMGAIDDDCDQQLDKVDGDMSNPETTPLFPEGASDECAGDSCFDGGEGAGMAEYPGDSYDDYYVLSNVIGRDGLTFTIEEAFFDDMLDNPAWLLADGGRLVPIFGGAAFEFQGIQSGEVLNKLGITNGDRVRELNGIQIEDWDDVLYAFWELRSETEFELELYRAPNIITRNYEVVP